jgi:hypothetical protein
MLSHIRVWTGVGVTIRELAETIAHVVGRSGSIVSDVRKGQTVRPASWHPVGAGVSSTCTVGDRS